MEILPSSSEYKPRVLGDVYFGYLIPTVLCGRCDTFRKDLCSFLSEWLSLVLVSDVETFLKDHPDFGLSSIGNSFKTKRFSKVLTVSPKEVTTDVWQVFWGVWADVFKGYVAEGCDGAPLLYSVACIYLMFYLYHCQCGPDVLPIPLARDTISYCLDTCAIALERFSKSTVLDTFYYLFRRHSIIICLNDGLQYIPQDRLGRPIALTRKAADEPEEEEFSTSEDESEE
ncbi:hypothetical protein BgAZ_402470 [Babesia gibsoni]|uniref:Uncharacterized protein n=1 Tax=Babesia gibsoni TaxID=33632 RepID=A0AAD8PDE9_BABGI|nr:hypothetical protein BgAZ_402470 [Babesia gibsoni]